MTKAKSSLNGDWLILLYFSGTSPGQYKDNSAILRELEKTSKGLGANATCLYQLSGTSKTVWGAILDDGKQHILYEGDPIDITKPEFLTKFIDWGVGRTRGPRTDRPRIALFVKDDGTGWEPDLPKKNESARGAREAKPFALLFNGRRFMPLSGLRVAVQKSGVGAVDIYGFDGCDMGTLETMYEIRRIAQIGIAGNSTVDKAGFSYAPFLYRMRSDSPPLTVPEAARCLVQLTRSNPKTNDQGIFGVDLARVDRVAAAVDALGLALDAQDAGEISAALEQRVLGNEDVVLTVLLDVVQNLGGDVGDKARALRGLLSELYIPEKASENGLTIFMPAQGSQYFAHYGATAFGRRVSPSRLEYTWGEFLGLFNAKLLAAASTCIVELGASPASAALQNLPPTPPVAPTTAFPVP